MRVIRQSLLIRKEECTIDGLQADMERLIEKMIKYIIPQRPGRKYPRKTKQGKYRKYK
jgi:hypothetical protein